MSCLGACQGKLDYASISEALQVLYDEQMIGSSRGDWGGEGWSDYYDND